MDPALIFSVFSALAAALWSVWTWREQQDKEWDVRRTQESALFVNSFIQALQELQARLYGILEGDDLAFYKQKYPKQECPEKTSCASRLAVEVLYRLGKCFGWAYYTYRYGAYINDPVVIEHVRKMTDTVEDRSLFPEDSFRFTYEERIALGEMVVQRSGDKLGAIPVYESITLFQFKDLMALETGQHYQVFQSQSVRQTMAAIDEAQETGTLVGEARLSLLQNQVVDLLTYLETMEGFSVSPRERHKVPLKGAAAQYAPADAIAAPATVVHLIPGRIRLLVPALRMDESLESKLHTALRSLDHVQSVRINASAASVIIGFNPAVPAEKFADTLVESLVTV